MLPENVFIQEIGGTLYVNRSVQGASNLINHKAAGTIGVYKLEREVRVVQTVTIEDLPRSEVAAAAPQN